MHLASSAESQRVAELLTNDARFSARIEAANETVLARLQSADPVLKRVLPASDVVPGMSRETVLHSGPPIAWEDMCDLLRASLKAAVVFEGICPTLEEAERQLAQGQISLRSCHEVGGVAPLAGVVTASMPVFLVEDVNLGTQAFCPINEGLGKVLRYGAYGPEVFNRLRWMGEVLGPVLDKVLRKTGGIPVFGIMSHALHMGDECHNRHKAGTTLFLKALIPALLGEAGPEVEQAVAFISKTDVFFLNIAMPGVKCSTMAVEHVADSSIVTVLSQNGTRFGIRTAGTGKTWFEADAPFIKGKFFSGFDQSHANPGIGDSLITETMGFGGLAMAAAPALVRYIGGDPAEAKRLNELMYGIVAAEHPKHTIPSLNFRGTPFGIDVRKVVSCGVTPVANAGIAHRVPGEGQVGAGYIHTPMRCFEKALAALHKTLTEDPATQSS